MKSQSRQKVLQIGSSIGITIPANEARHHRIKQGTTVELTIESSRDGLVILRILRPSWWKRLIK